MRLFTMSGQLPGLGLLMGRGQAGPSEVAVPTGTGQSLGSLGFGPLVQGWRPVPTLPSSPHTSLPVTPSVPALLAGRSWNVPRSLIIQPLHQGLPLPGALSSTPLHLTSPRSWVSVQTSPPGRGPPGLCPSHLCFISFRAPITH